MWRCDDGSVGSVMSGDPRIRGGAMPYICSGAQP